MALRCIPASDVDRLLQGGEVHVWSVTVADWLPMLGTLGELLSEAEQERAARYRFERDCIRFMLCRGLLRTLLGDYLSRDPREIEFQFGPQEKPELAGGAGPCLEFNLSHSDQAALFAFAIGKRVGVDIERVRSGIDVEGLAKQVFTEPEKQMLSAAPKREKEELFYEVWTQKEAYIKAVGQGLSAPVRKITVGVGLILRGDEPGTGIVETEETQWSLWKLRAPAGYKSALAVEGRIASNQILARPLPAES